MLPTNVPTGGTTGQQTPFVDPTLPPPGTQFGRCNGSSLVPGVFKSISWQQQGMWLKPAFRTWYTIFTKPADIMARGDNLTAGRTISPVLHVLASLAHRNVGEGGSRAVHTYVTSAWRLQAGARPSFVLHHQTNAQHQ